MQASAKSNGDNEKVSKAMLVSRSREDKREGERDGGREGESGRETSEKGIFVLLPMVVIP